MIGHLALSRWNTSRSAPGALGLEQMEHLPICAGESLVVALSLGDHQIGSPESFSQLRAAVIQQRARHIRAIVYHLDQPGQPGSLGILQSGVIDHRRTPDDEGHALSGHPLEQQPVEHDLPGIVAEKQN